MRDLFLIVIISIVALAIFSLLSGDWYFGLIAIIIFCFVSIVLLIFCFPSERREYQEPTRTIEYYTEEEEEVKNPNLTVPTSGNNHQQIVSTPTRTCRRKYNSIIR